MEHFSKLLQFFFSKKCYTLGSCSVYRDIFEDFFCMFSLFYDSEIFSKKIWCFINFCDFLLQRPSKWIFVKTKCQNWHAFFSLLNFSSKCLKNGSLIGEIGKIMRFFSSFFHCFWPWKKTPFSHVYKLCVFCNKYFLNFKARLARNNFKIFSKKIP